MSGSGDSGGSNGQGPEVAALRTLELAVGRALARIEELGTRAVEAEARSAELAEIVRRFTGDRKDAERLLSRLDRLESENTDLRTRVDRGREGVERLLARVRFLEDRK